MHKPLKINQDFTVYPPETNSSNQKMDAWKTIVSFWGPIYLMAHDSHIAKIDNLRWVLHGSVQAVPSRLRSKCPSLAGRLATWQRFFVGAVGTSILHCGESRWRSPLPKEAMINQDMGFAPPIFQVVFSRIRALIQTQHRFITCTYIRNARKLPCKK